jgi:hypothetical protein
MRITRISRAGIVIQHPALGSFTPFKVSQSDLDGFPSNFCPASLRIFGEDCGCFGILDFQVKNFNDAVINLNVCHRYSPYRKTVQ